MARMRDFAHEAEEAVFGHHRHHDEPRMAPHVEAALAARQTPAVQPATMAPAGAATKENRMSLSTLEDDVKADLTQGLDYLIDFGTRLKSAAPGIIATSEAVGSSTVGALVEAVGGAILPPQLEQVAVDFVKDLVGKYGSQPVQAAAPVAQTVTAQTAVAPAVQ